MLASIENSTFFEANGCGGNNAHVDACDFVHHQALAALSEISGTPKKYRTEELFWMRAECLQEQVELPSTKASKKNATTAVVWVKSVL